MRSTLGLVLLATACHCLDECGDASDCTSCLEPSHGSGNCGWCAPTSVIYADGSQGARCADLRDKSHGGGWECSGKLMKDQCLMGYVCGGEATNYQCIPATKPGDGNPTFNDCQAGCTPRPSFKCTDKSKGQCYACTDPTEPGCTTDYAACQSSCVDDDTYSCNTATGQCEVCDPKHPSPSCVGKAACDGSCSVKYSCDFPSDTTAQPQCKPCTDPTDASCTYATSSDCSADCSWKYACDLSHPSGPTCKKSPYGIPKLEWCTEQCHVSYECDEAAGTCSMKKGGGGPFTSNATCSASCPSKATPTIPYELIGVWRGLELHNGFARGEWTANVTRHHITLYTPDLKVYLQGNASHKVATKNTVTGELWVQSTSGVLTGSVKLIYGDSNLEPELAYVALAVSETTPATRPSTYDAAMTTQSDKVFGMYKCKDDANCKFHLPAALPQPTRARSLAERAWGGLKHATSASSVAAAGVSDPCNQFTSCSSCIAATAGDLSCGWCTRPVQYNDSSAPQYQCAGHKTGVASGWTCYGVFRTISCYDYACDPTTQTCKKCDEGEAGMPTLDACEKGCTAPSPWQRCSLEGIYRGLQIDLNYGMGEWGANFSVYSQFTVATFTFAPTGYTFSGQALCRNADATKLASEGDLKLTLTNGTTLYGIYKDGGSQAETTGLALALSNVGMQVPPTDFPSAMPGLNATVYGYTKCADYKKGICKF